MYYLSVYIISVLILRKMRRAWV